MAPRPNWKGFLKLSLVSCSVAMYTATSTSQRVRFNIINKKTGNRIRNEVVDSETGDPVDQDDRVKGYKLEGNDYLLLDDEQLGWVERESGSELEGERARLPLGQREAIEEHVLGGEWERPALL